MHKMTMYAQDDKGNFEDICQLEEFFQCKDDRVYTINLRETKYTEKGFPFEYIPPLVVSFKARLAYLH